MFDERAPITLLRSRTSLGHGLFEFVAKESLVGAGVGEEHIQTFSPFAQGAKLEKAAGWAMDAVYQIGGKGKVGEAVYTLVRSLGRGRGRLTNWTTAVNRRRLENYPGIAIATQALLASAKGKDYSIISDPVVDWAAVTNADFVLVPSQDLADALAARGHDKRLIITAGYFVPQAVKDEKYRNWRVGRLEHGERLTLGIYFNGQAPKDHVRKTEAAMPKILPRVCSGELRLVVNTGTNQVLEAKMRQKLASSGLRLRELGAGPDWQGWVFSGKSGMETVEKAVAAAPLLDVLVTMPNERMAWSAFIPQINPFYATNPNAKADETFSATRGYAIDRREAADFGSLVEKLVRPGQRGRLLEVMNRAYEGLKDNVSGGEVLAKVVTNDSRFERLFDRIQK